MLENVFKTASYSSVSMFISYQICTPWNNVKSTLPVKLLSFINSAQFLQKLRTFQAHSVLPIKASGKCEPYTKTALKRHFSCKNLTHFRVWVIGVLSVLQELCSSVEKIQECVKRPKKCTCSSSGWNICQGVFLSQLSLDYGERAEFSEKKLNPSMLLINMKISQSV